jgi:hypothetical protein
MKMNKNLIYFDEPDIAFGYNQTSRDPRDGLSLFGPFEKFSSQSIQAGVVGTQKGIEFYSEFVQRLQKPIISKSTQRPSYLGFESIFGVKWSSKPTINRAIDEDKLNELLAIGNSQERTYKVVNLFLDEMKKVKSEEESQINIWFVVIPKSVWLKCRPLSLGTKIPSSTRTEVLAFQEGQHALFPEVEEQLEEMSEVLDSSSDFHHQLKARVINERVEIPIQIILETTLMFKDKYTETEYEDEMKAHLAWTQSSTVYYKLGKLPWKLQNIREGVCYVGLVFKRFEHLARKGCACSAAQMFLDSGDGTVFRGNIGPWLSKNEKEYHLDKESAKELLAKALSSYRNNRKEYPKEIFIHGRARFNQDEWDGFREAVKDASEGISLVGVVIKESGKLKIFREVVGQDCKYGNLRGLGLIVNPNEGFIWTRGFVPRLNTSTSLEIPNPLRVQIVRGESKIFQVLKDILALTKLNYNACIYGDGIPVTLRFSDQIGSILTAIDDLENELLPFKYYI